MKRLQRKWPLGHASRLNSCIVVHAIYCVCVLAESRRVQLPWNNWISAAMISCWTGNGWNTLLGYCAINKS